MCCETLRGSPLQPYWLIAFTSILFMILSWIWNLISLYLRPFYTKWLCCSCLQNNKVVSSNQLNTSSSVLKRILWTDLSSSYFVCQYLYWWIHVVVSILTLDGNKWDCYEKLGIIMYNSGITNLLASTMIKLFYTENIKMLFVMIVLEIPLMPWMFTHVLPMVLLYFPILILYVVLILAFLGILVALFCLLEYCGFFAVNLSREGILWKSLIKLCILFGFTVILQTFYNYGVLVYSSTNTRDILTFKEVYWNDVVTKEWKLRDSVCYWESYNKDIVEVLRMMTFIF